ncbi:amino acid ABC transporter substrate-binding protein [Gemmatimonadetes bacterium T265]|nr:amino acid ABC transporter substrate-binding protein [Gemmatimonadetes bacterium T265]
MPNANGVARALAAAAWALGGVAAAQRPAAQPPVSPPGPAAGPGVLRVCADPNNLPFSDRRGAGFENRIAAELARGLGRRLAYYWWPERRGFARNTVSAGRCDLVVGVPAGYGFTLNTRPYYRSTYALVTRAERYPGLRALDDPRLARLRVGVHYLGGKAVPPPVVALNARHVPVHVVSYSIFGDYTDPDPPAALIRAVARGDVDVAIAWGPLAGPLARRSPVALRVVPLPPGSGAPGQPLEFAVAAGVRRGDTALLAAVQRVLDRRAGAIGRILDAYAVPRLALTSPPIPTPSSGAGTQ